MNSFWFLMFLAAVSRNSHQHEKHKETIWNEDCVSAEQESCLNYSLDKSTRSKIRCELSALNQCRIVR